ncbi:hypothetical protein CLRAG_33400 [Clostridium ragsdalei P11]|uniref:Uncharacterized protein n=1 Tax=Clostridium ragsdalei P11 TaxID=1353534 RepID=A0A1A6AKT2_9CLOT|nr:hypothetical protein [Clostridium ragsdalei]OBR90692.1 hypothetical protein CLRAG_33400 [Clostridium ragsdalei P11]
MVQKIINLLLRKVVPKPTDSRYVEDILYNQMVYPIYSEVQHKLIYCLKNKQITRDQLITFKNMLNACVRNPYTYKDRDWKNDAHEIFTKLKSHYIKPKEMKKLLKYINQFYADIPEPIQEFKTVPYLKVIK